MILLASGSAWGLSATNAEDMVASFDYEQAGEKIHNQLAVLFTGFSDLTSDLTEPLGQMELPEALQALQRFGENIRSSEQTLRATLDVDSRLKTIAACLYALVILDVFKVPHPECMLGEEWRAIRHTLVLLHLNLARLPELQLCSQLRLLAHSTIP